MSRKVVVKALSDTSVKVNGKVVYKDQESNWVACSELSSTEHEAFTLYESEVIADSGIATGEHTYTI